MRSELREAIRRLHSDDYYRIAATEKELHKVKRQRIVRRLTWWSTFSNTSKISFAIFMVCGLFVIFLVWGGIYYYNAFAGANREIEKTQSLIESEIKRRANLIPNLAVVAAEYSAHEVILYRYVSEMRTLIGNQKTKPAPETFRSLDKLSGSLLAVAEEYPDLKASRSFEQLMKDWTETENRIAKARADYIIAVRNYNTLWTRFPSDVYAFCYRFKKHPCYSYDEFSVPPLDIKKFYSTYFTSRVGHMPSSPFASETAVISQPPIATGTSMAPATSQAPIDANATVGETPRN